MRDFSIGQRAFVSRTFHEEDVLEYRELFGEPAGGDTVPGPLIGGLFSYLLGTVLPGRGTNWMKQSLDFRESAEIGTELVASVEIVRVRPEKDLVNLRTLCVDATGKVICEGEALVMAREMV